MDVATTITGVTLLIASAGYGVRWAVLDTGATAWPKGHVLVRWSLLLMAAISALTGLLALRSAVSVPPFMTLFCAVHSLAAVIMAVNLLRQVNPSELHFFTALRDRAHSKSAAS